MKHLALPLLAALWLSASAATAQTTFHIGLRGGANRALTTLDLVDNSSGSYQSSSSADKSAIYAWQAGLVLEASFGKWAVQPALLFSQKGEHSTIAAYQSGVAGYNSQEASSINRYNWVELPLNVVYTRHGNHGWQVFAGPYVAVAVGGRQRGETALVFYGPPYQAPNVYRSSDFDNHVDYGQDTPNRRLDAGVNVGVGYRQGPVQAQVGYALGLLNLRSTNATQANPYGPDFRTGAAYNRVLQLTGTYFFAL